MTADTQKDWAGDAQNASQDGEFKRDTNYINDRIVASATGTEGPLWLVQPHRYRLIAARACPWAHRAVIVRLCLI